MPRTKTPEALMIAHLESLVPARIGHHAAAWLIAWSLILVASFWWFEEQHREEIRETAKSVALAHARQDALLRTWSSRLGGVYLPSRPWPLPDRG
jgi:hypothetical protein